MPYQLLYYVLLFGCVVVAISDEQKIPRSLRHLLNCFNHGAKEGVRHIGNNQPQRFVVLMGQGSRIRVGVVVEFMHRLEDGIA
ncbi:hypothetical protein VAWG006_31520 [Aeromonas enteropelogenes]|nr:hypothetical protein VAWG006_31520 [Aeromonas enteropelogenes]BEE23063.1 hypothetical protein VAWG007_31580 [Aeromonas enteropelogenes]